MDYLSKNIHWLFRIHLCLAFIYHGYPKLGVSVANLGYIGYLIPFDGYSYHNQNGNLIDPGSILQVGISNYWEYKNNSALFWIPGINFPK